jgi:serine/threonine-protein kinase
MVEAFMPLCPLTVGDLVQGKYQIDAILGEGGMGIVYAATHVELHCPVALKVIRQELSQEPELVARLMLEARAAAQIKSEHVCRVLDVGRLHSGAPFVVMEYLRGRNLATILRAKGRFPERISVDYLLQACEAIAEAHRSGVIHRDLKPENLFLAEFPDGHRAIKVLDFGISKTTGTFVKPAARSLTNPSSAMGSPHYMAPEQMSAARDVDIRADIWALGAILYEFLTGHVAFQGDSLPVVCAAVLQSNPKPLREHADDLSEELESIVLECLMKDRERRPSSVAELAMKIAPFGTVQAAESVIRIRRLLDDPTRNALTDVEHASGTLFSPRSAATPREVIAQRDRLVRTPVETAAGVSSTKESAAVAPPQQSSGTRHRWPIALGALALLGVAFATRSITTTVLRPEARTSVVPPASSNLRATETLHALPESSPSVIPIPVATGPVATKPVATEPVEAKPVATEPVEAKKLALDPPPVEPTRKPPVAIQPRNGSTAKLPTAAVKPKATKTDPYDLDNFGGRR